MFIMLAFIGVVSASAAISEKAVCDTSDIDLRGANFGWGGVIEASLSASYERASSPLVTMSMWSLPFSKTLDRWNIPSLTPAQAGTSMTNSTRFLALIPSLSPVHPGSTPFLSFSPTAEVATGLLNYK